MHRVIAALAVLATLLTLPTLSACKGTQDKEAAAKVQLGEERLNVLSNPSVFLDASDLVYDDDASAHDTWQLVAVTVYNRSHFTVRDLRGDITWLDEEGHHIGKSPIALNGFIPAESSNTFSIQASTLTSVAQSGAVVSASISFHRVTLDN